MACTTILVGKDASYDGSTMIARTEDTGAGSYIAKKFTVFSSEEQPPLYRSVISHVEIRLPQNPMRFCAVPNAINDNGIWAASGVNAINIGMTATETITSNPRVLGADPLVVYQPATQTTPEKPGGIGEEDMVYITLPYIHSAREGVELLGAYLETYGTYEMNGIAFQDENEIWWLETIGGHHWLAKKVPDDNYVVMPNQLGIDSFDLMDALYYRKQHMCSSDMIKFITKNHLSLLQSTTINPREVFGSHDDSDHIYNTPRAWFMLRYFNPNTYKWDGQNAEFSPRDDNLPWSMVPDKKITPEDVKYILSSHYQGTPYDPYDSSSDSSVNKVFRPIGINRTSFTALIQIRPYLETPNQVIMWLAFASNVFNTMVPFYTNITSTPAYFSDIATEVSTQNIYWSSRLLGAMADASYHTSIVYIERYQSSVLSKGREIINHYDELLKNETDQETQMKMQEAANQALSDMVQKETATALDHVLYELSNQMKNSYSRSDG